MLEFLVVLRDGRKIIDSEWIEAESESEALLKAKKSSLLAPLLIGKAKLAVEDYINDGQ